MQFLDTNIILRYLTHDDPVKAQACFVLLQQVKNGQVQLQTTEAIIAEVTYVLTSPRQPYKKSHQEVAAWLKPIVQLRHLALPRKRVVQRALDLYDLYPQLDFEDALSVATMEQTRQPEILSYDGDFDAIPGITRHEP